LEDNAVADVGWISSWLLDLVHQRIVEVLVDVAGVYDGNWVVELLGCLLISILLFALYEVIGSLIHSCWMKLSERFDLLFGLDSILRFITAAQVPWVDLVLGNLNIILNSNIWIDLLISNRTYEMNSLPTWMRLSIKEDVLLLCSLSVWRMGYILWQECNCICLWRLQTLPIVLFIYVLLAMGSFHSTVWFASQISIDNWAKLINLLLIILILKNANQMLQCLQILVILLTLQDKRLDLILEVSHYRLLVHRTTVYLSRFVIIGSIFDIADSDLYTLKGLLDHLGKLLDLIDLSLSLNLLILIWEDALLQLSQRTLQ